MWLVVDKVELAAFDCKSFAPYLFRIYLITNIIAKISRVTYDVSSQPHATIEWVHKFS